MSFWRILSLGLLGALALPLGALAEPLPADVAFRATVRASQREQLVVAYDIADGYYLYRQKLAFATATPGASLGAAVLPKGEIKHDENFGDMEIYRGHMEAALPLTVAGGVSAVDVVLTLQGCADKGLCYPPQKRMVRVGLPGTQPSSVSPTRALDRLSAGLRGLNPAGRTADLLPPDEAFPFQAEVRDAHTLRVFWRTADGYYLYRDKFRFQLADAGLVRLGEVRIPQGEPFHDEEFGNVEVFHGELAFDLPLLRTTALQAQPIRLTAHFQGCADRGVCYPPMEKTVALALPAVDAATPPAQSAPPVVRSEQDRIAEGFYGGSVGWTLLSFLGFGFLLSFTPCTFPMIPILSGIVVGDRQTLGSWRGLSLSLAFVLASAATYTLFGVLAALTGANLQALLQNPAVLVASSVLFVILALSMFGFYSLQLPLAVQDWLDRLGRRQRGGTYLGAALMGALSTLIIGPCVAAPLAGALLYIGQTGDVWLGGAALFALGLGAGLPLLAIGASAGKLLPRAGLWMDSVKNVFGVLLLAVAIWLVARVVPTAVSMTLWAVLLMVSATFLGALDGLPVDASGWRRLWKGLGLILLTLGVLLLIGAASGSKDPLQPLRVLAQRGGDAGEKALAFRRVRSVAELDSALDEARIRHQPVMLDFYADWCVSCQELERDTFQDGGVRQILAGALLLQANVTANSDEDQALLRRFGLFGPPAVLFFGADGQERPAYRTIGYMASAPFRLHASAALQCAPETQSC